MLEPLPYGSAASAFLQSMQIRSQQDCYGESSSEICELISKWKKTGVSNSVEFKAASLGTLVAMQSVDIT